MDTQDSPKAWESSTSEEEFVLSERVDHRKTASVLGQKKQRKTIEFCSDTSDEESPRKHDIVPLQSIENDGKKQKTKRKNQNHARNTSYALKTRCCVIHEVKRFLQFVRCTCTQNCLHKLWINKSEATPAIYQMRQDRFTRTWQLCYHRSQTEYSLYITPG